MRFSGDSRGELLVFSEGPGACRATERSWQCCGHGAGPASFYSDPKFVECRDGLGFVVRSCKEVALAQNTYLYYAKQ
jgi:hypothetical protein